MTGGGREVGWLNDRALEVAPRLLGAVLRVGNRSGLVVEVEAYEGADDGASHAARGPTPRNRVMFGPAGFLYVYRIYGMHWCANVVCGPADEPGAVLIRAIEPRDGIEQMWADRPKARRPTDLGSGPGKLCAALGIDGRHDGIDLLADPDPVPSPGPTGPTGPRLERPGRREPVASIVTGPRVGITKAAARPWRFALADHPHVSRPRPTEPYRPGR